MKVLSLFSGCGGFDLGFIEAGYEIVWANDIDKNACKTYRFNLGPIKCEDIRQILLEDLPNEFDVLIGGFPCQGFSVNNKNRTVSDERNFLYREMLRVLENKRPKVVVAENVKGILSLGKGNVINKIITDFQNLGYNVKYQVLNAKDFGVPQSRERVFIVGIIDKDFVFPQKENTAISVRDAIGHLAESRTRDDSFKVKNETIHNHVARENVSDTFFARKYKVDQKEIANYLKKHKKFTTKAIDDHFGYNHTAGHWFRTDQWGSLPNPEQWMILKKLLDFDDTHDLKMTTLVEKKITFEQSKRIVDWDRPSRTITASNVEIHPNRKRRLSVREAAILQSFPNNFEFTGSLTSMYRQIGNSVPPKLAYAIAVQLKQYLV